MNKKIYNTFIQAAERVFSGEIYFSCISIDRVAGDGSDEESAFQELFGITDDLSVFEYHYEKYFPGEAKLISSKKFEEDIRECRVMALCFAAHILSDLDEEPSVYLKAAKMIDVDDEVEFSCWAISLSEGCDIDEHTESRLKYQKLYNCGYYTFQCLLDDEVNSIHPSDQANYIRDIRVLALLFAHEFFKTDLKTKFKNS